MPFNTNIKTITDLRERTTDFIAGIKKSEKPAIVFKGSKPQMAVLPLPYYQKLLEMIEDYEDTILAEELIANPESGGKSLEEVARELGVKLKGV